MKNLISISLGPGPLVGPSGGPLSNPTKDSAASLFSSTISKIIGVMTVVAFIWFTFMVVIGAIRIIASGGDKAAVEGARKQITTGVIGVVVLVAAVFLVSLVGTILGIPNILDPKALLGL